MGPEAAAANEAILSRVEEIGGGSVWDAEVFAVSLMEVAVGEDEALKLCGLTGVQQIVLNSSLLSFSTLKVISSIPGLRSLVLVSPAVSAPELAALGANGLKVEVVGQ
ncbi:hypothetical protein [Nevskia ramosa]|uniref:hypothetical protein n=1 Tax=Nevskia ramosa TaxID=64002 RepID=UPI003D134711